MTALAVGIAADEGLLQPDDLLSDHLPARLGGYGAGIEAVRLRHLLSMTSGFLGARLPRRAARSPGPHLPAAGTTWDAEPGQRWEYSNGSTSFSPA